MSRTFYSFTYSPSQHPRLLYCLYLVGLQVLIRGGDLIPSAPAVFKFLNEKKIPYVFLTNGGGSIEKEKADAIGKMLGIHIPANKMILSHTPMKQLVPKYENELVLLMGKDKIKEIAASYGFKKTVRCCDLHSQAPGMPCLINKQCPL